jgi:hypothetical protein
MGDAITPYDHVRAGEEAPVAPGVYRVVGTGDPVALLRLTDADGQRANTGDVVTVPQEVYHTSFDPADNPDDGFSPTDLLDPLVAQATAIPYWLRKLVGR